MEKYLPYLSILVAMSAIALSQLKTRGLAAVEVRLVAIETKVALYWSTIERNAAQLLHSPHRPELDRLLDKHLAGETLSTAEAWELTRLLDELINQRDGDLNQLFMAQQLKQVTIAKYGLHEAHV